MAKKPFKSYVRNGVFTILSFVMAILLFILSLCIILSATLFNSNFIIDNMNSSNYFNDKTDEVVESLTDLGFASGLDYEFFDELVNEVMVNEDTKIYLDKYYEGTTNTVDLTSFKQRFNEQLDKYIEENNIKNVKSSSRESLIKQAGVIYKQSLSIPLFVSFSGYFKLIKSALPFVIISLILLITIIVAVFFLGNKWKHRAVKYTYFATSASFLSVGMIPTFLLLSGKIKQINLDSRALYNSFIQCGNSLCVGLIVCSVFLLLVSIGLYIKYRNMYRKISN